MPNLALGPAMATSETQAKPNPPPMTAPSVIAMTTFEDSLTC